MQTIRKAWSPSWRKQQVPTCSKFGETNSPIALVAHRRVGPTRPSDRLWHCGGEKHRPPPRGAGRNGAGVEMVVFRMMGLGRVYQDLPGSLIVLLGIPISNRG